MTAPDKNNERVAAAPAAQLADREAREQIRTALDRTMVVEASAGTGKTTELVNRIIAVLAAGRATVDGIVAVTFTEKAAGEMKLRLRAGLEAARHATHGAPRQRKNLENALAHLEEAHLGTIHGFCGELLRERPVEARVDPLFSVMTEPEARRLYAEVFDRWLQTQLHNPADGTRRALRRLSRGSGTPSDRLRAAGWQLIQWRDFPASWQRPPFDRRAAIDALAERTHRLAALTARCAKPDKDGLYRSTWRARQLSAEWAAARDAGKRDDDAVEAALVEIGRDTDFGRWKGYGRMYGDGVSRAEVREALEELRREAQACARKADADLAALLHGELRATAARYEEQKERAGRLDFVDLLVRTRKLLHDHASVRRDFQKRFSHLFVDEFQDTDPLQAEILLLLAADDPDTDDWRAVCPVPGKLFTVGDPKQSIYRFRRADVGIYRRVTELLVRHGALKVDLRTSFRAVPSLQRLVNTAFTPLMTGDRKTLQARYVPLAPHRADAAAQPSIIALPVPAPYGRRAVTARAIEGSLPQAAAAFVRWLLDESGWTVTERNSRNGRVPLAPRHICLLFRRFDSFYTGDVTRGYLLALEARGIPHLLVGGKSFHNREEVGTLRAALSAIEWPDDELSVFATLHGSLFAIDDESLLAYRYRFGALHPFRAPADLPAEIGPIGDALALLREFHLARNSRPVADTIERLLAATRAHGGFVLRPSGEQALANVLHLAELARQYEASGAISFRGFVEQLCEDAERGEAPQAPILEEGSEGVRLMTVHKAKGLEFPVVLLADITAKLARRGAARYLDARRGLCAQRIGGWAPRDLVEHEDEEHARDEAEGVRIAYVAATRARDLLVVPAVGDEPYRGGWVAPLNGALYPAPEDRRRAEAASACPAFGADSVLARPAELACDAKSVRPGRHEFPARGYSVVWWDPALLHLNAPPRFGIRQRQLLDKDADPKLVAADRKSHDTWHENRGAAVAAGSRPSLVTQTATAWAAQAAGPPPEVEIVALPRAANRPAGPRFGSLVHAVLAAAGTGAEREELARAAALQGRILGAPEEEVAAAVTAAARAFAHPLLRRAHAAARCGRCRREVPVAYRDGDGKVIDGVIDLVFLEEGLWTVVDFKTDRELEAEALDTYRRQVGLYAASVAAATGCEARAVLMRV